MEAQEIGTHEGWGGKRQGAGRKREVYRSVTLRLKPETDQRVEQLSKELGISKGKVVDLIVEQYIENIEEEE